MKPEKIKLSANLESGSYINSIMDNAVQRIHKELFSQLEEAFIEGLRLKGFEFETRFDLEDFIKSRCRCEDNLHFKQKIYYVDEIPFFLHNYDSKIITDPRITGDSNKIVGELGTFKFL